MNTEINDNYFVFIFCTDAMNNIWNAFCRFSHDKRKRKKKWEPSLPICLTILDHFFICYSYDACLFDLFCTLFSGLYQHPAAAEYVEFMSRKLRWHSIAIVSYTSKKRIDSMWWNQSASRRILPLFCSWFSWCVFD